MKRAVMLFGMVAVLVSPTLLSAQTSTFDLPLGDPARKDRQAPLVLDGVTDTATGQVITPADLPARLKDVRLLLLGESHTSMDFHRVQLRVLQELQKASRQVLIGLEMYPYTEQAYLDQWIDGLLTEDGFLRLSQWYKNWGYHWQYYRDIFLFARDHKIRMFGVNTPRTFVTAVRKKGLENLTEDEAAHIPKKIDTSNTEYRELFKTFMSEAGAVHPGATTDMLNAMFEAQCTWDATMAYNSVKALEAVGGKDAIMVVLAGSGHVAYGLGIERQAALWFDGKTASLIPIPVVDDKGVAYKVRASYANFLWGLPVETDVMFPTLGLSLPVAKQGDYYRVLAVEKESVAAGAGFERDDLLLSMDGVPILQHETLNRLMSEKRWGDGATFVVKRGGQTLTLTAVFRRRPAPGPPKTTE